MAKTNVITMIKSMNFLIVPLSSFLIDSKNEEAIFNCKFSLLNSINYTTNCLKNVYLHFNKNTISIQFF